MVSSIEIVGLAPRMVHQPGGRELFCMKPEIQRDSPTHLPGFIFVSNEDQMRCGFLQKAASAAQIKFEELEEWHHPQKQGGYQPESVVEKSVIHGFMTWTGAKED